MKQYYEYTLKAYGKDKIKTRYDYLLRKVNEFLLSRNMDSYISVNYQILQELIIDYFSDTHRIRDFLKKEKNVSSYLGYWIMKKKPLAIADRQNYKMRMERPLLEYVNEWFVFHIILNFKLSPGECRLFWDV